MKGLEEVSTLVWECRKGVTNDGFTMMQLPVSTAGAILPAAMTVSASLPIFDEQETYKVSMGLELYISFDIRANRVVGVLQFHGQIAAATPKGT